MNYFPPPEDYESPSADGCRTCGDDIIFVPVVNGHKWTHLVQWDRGHEADPGRWWETATGTWREGPFSSELDAARVPAPLTPEDPPEEKP